MSDKAGFELRELRLCGQAVPPARLTFTTGLNVIEGASDTGKSYAVTFIDFLLGAKDAPDEIPQARGYNVGYLQVEEQSDGEQFTFKRALGGGKIALFKGSIDQALTIAGNAWQTLGVNASAHESVSGFLLNMCGLADKRVRSDEYGKTQTVSFRVLAKALIVDEERIIAKRSPLYGTQRTGDTAAENTIRLLLTGVDDSEMVQPEDRKVAAGRISGRKEVVEALIAQDEETLRELGNEGEDLSTEQDLAEIDRVLSELSARSSAALGELRAAEANRRQAWIERRGSEERLRDLGGMLVRAELLGQHYVSDLRRLEALAESAYVLGHYPEEPCAYCGADPAHQNHQDGTVLQGTIAAARVEAAKVQRLGRELEQATSQMTSELSEVRACIETLDNGIADLSLSIESELAPRTRETAAHLRELQEQYGKLIRVHDIRARIKSLKGQLDAFAGGGGSREKFEFVGLSANSMSGVCEEVSLLLDAWGFAKKPTVAYNEKTADLHIDGRSRVSHGKGVRALTCAAFVIAIMRHGIKNALGHPGFVVIDTPLNPYKAADVTDGGAVAQPVKAAFYRHLCTSSPGQVIIFENEPAPLEVQSKCNYQHFSGNEVGRQGFIPTQGSPTS